MTVAFTLILNALVATLVLALAALGLAIIFGMMGVINLAHGAFIAIGAYVAWFATNAGNFWIGLILAPVVVGVIGYGLEVTIVKRLYHRPLDTILATWGVALVIREGLKLGFGVTTKNVPLPITGGIDIGVVYPVYRLFLIVASILIIGFVFVVLVRTEFGVRLRAVIQDAEAASLLGINQSRVFSFTFSFGAALAGLAGAALAPIATVSPDMGLPFLVESFFAVILGGTPLGVLVGSAVIGGSSSFLSFMLSPVVAEIVVFVFAIVIVLIRPQGIIDQ